MATAAAQKTFRQGIVWGKFYPLHRGHQRLIDAAIAACESVVIAVSFRAGETIPQETRCAWIRELYPGATCVALRKTLPYVPEECATPEAFYRIWRDVCVEACGGVPDAAFTSEPEYDRFIVDYLRCRHVLVDPARDAVPVSGTKVREDPLGQWEFLDPVVRAYFVPTVCVWGAESCGKTTMAARLAKRFDTVWQPEWARDYLGERHCEFADMEIIAEGHLRDRRRFLLMANRLLIADTDTITTKIYSEEYYGKCPPRVEEIIALPENQIDFYLLLNTDVPWVPDTSRDLGAPEARARMMHRFERESRERALPHEVITGPDRDARFSQAVTAIERFLSRPRRA